MNNIEFFTENKEYKIKITKLLKPYCLSKYGQYKITINFIDIMEQIILSINTNEKELFQAILQISGFINGSGFTQDDIVYFDNIGDGSSYFIYLSNLTQLNPYYNGPIEDDDVATLSFYHRTQQGNALKLYLETSFYYLEEFIYNMYQIIEDIPYLREMSDSYFFDFINGE